MPLENVQETSKRAIDKASHFPSRDPSTEQQINIRAPDKVLKRFRMLCRAERRTYADMLSRMMDAYGDPQS